MSLKTRVDKAEAEFKERLRAEWEAAGRPVQDLFLQAPDAEQAAYFRHFWSVRSTASWKLTDEQWSVLCGGVLEPQPGDDELIAALEARIPSEMKERLKAAAEAALAAGVDG